MRRAAAPGTGRRNQHGTSGADEHRAPQHPPGPPPGVAAAAPAQRKLGEYTTSELQGRRRELEHAIRHLSGSAPAQADLHRRLEEVQAEEESRARIAAANGRA